MRIVILTGAGVSAESGIATFRDADGLWEGHEVTQVATPEGYISDPELVHSFYNARRRQLLSEAVQPNAAHRALARLEAEHPGEVLVVTQNVDDLHERAGSRTVLHMHGELLKARCTSCEAVTEIRVDLSPRTVCPGCGAEGAVRPHIVWFGELPLHLQEIFPALGRCELFAAIGTSGAVYPAAGFVQRAASAGARTVELNLDASEVSSAFDEVRRGPAGQLVPQWVEELLS